MLKRNLLIKSVLYIGCINALSITLVCASTRAPGAPKEDSIQINNTKIFIKQGDLLGFAGGAIVNAANKELTHGGGVSGKIYDAAEGRDCGQNCFLKDYMEKNYQGGINVGEAVISPAFQLAPKTPGARGISHIIHAVGPDCRIKAQATNFEPLMKNAYQNSLRVADKYSKNVPDNQKIKSIAFPFISSDIYRCPLPESARFALEAIQKYLQDTPNTAVKSIYIVLLPTNKAHYDIFAEALEVLKSKIPAAQELQELLTSLEEKLFSLNNRLHSQSSTGW